MPRLDARQFEDLACSWLGDWRLVGGDAPRIGGKVVSGGAGEYPVPGGGPELVSDWGSLSRYAVRRRRRTLGRDFAP